MIDEEFYPMDLKGYGVPTRVEELELRLADVLVERDQLREEAERYRKALEEIDASGSVGPMAHKIASAALEPLPPSALRGATEDSTP